MALKIMEISEIKKKKRKKNLLQMFDAPKASELLFWVHHTKDGMESWDHERTYPEPVPWVSLKPCDQSEDSVTASDYY